ncbi:DUF4331 domain-containing protein [Merismopedia glauca]|uniref:DUF4331 domain-containing protein n=1 Tax=Merismopedia glauca CCAP 1448/3 TaxID=1296344 RepID=A0A2T1C5L0_9CYAN|nr:DUF4331 domain-containing protein [Merismopedia glauca]PSB03438.1 DUF4331 domain-containing protein [Merismopedia glauca CCAP 1448/3]
MKIKNLINSSLLLIAIALSTGVGFSTQYLKASDHDDGEVETKGRNLNLTDLYVFREKDQNPDAKEDDLVLIMNTNPRSLPRQQYFFSTKARYEFKISRVTNVDAPVTGKENVVLRFEFGAPNQKGQQRITATLIKDGKTFKSPGHVTTVLNAEPIVNEMSVANSKISVFAGLREDPFFFDVEQFFRVRAGLAGFGPKVGFRSPGYDFAAGYNVNSIVVRVPTNLLNAFNKTNVFDVWETISLADNNGKYKQVERLARPGINEGLIVSNDFLNALNSVDPAFEADALAGKEPAATTAAPIFGEAQATLKALGNDEKRVGELVGAFLPDVMRIDTSQPSGYGKALNAKGSPVRGRLIKDDVIDTTLTVLTNGAVKSDNVSYEGPNAGGSGHQSLSNDFPYLAPPN